MSRAQASGERKPTNFETQFSEELDAVLSARPQPKQWQDSAATKEDDDTGAASNQGQNKADSVYERAHDSNLFGLAFSGGGIRSATFNLGVIQCLAKLGLLQRVDYLSTVSGGGYIGGWLSSWIHRSWGSDVREVERCLNNPAICQKISVALPEPRQVRWLREFSNYLTPRLGALSIDTLTAVATYLRNLILNQTILVTFGASLMVLAWVFVALLQIPISGESTIDLILWIAATIAALLLFIGTYLAGFETQRACVKQDLAEQRTISTPVQNANEPQSVATQNDESHQVERKTRRLYWTMFCCFMFAAVIAGLFITRKPDLWRITWALMLGGAYGIGTSVGWGAAAASSKPLRRSSNPPTPSDRDKLSYFQPGAVVAGIGLGGLVWSWSYFVQNYHPDLLSSAISAVALGPVVILGAILLTITLHLGLTGRKLREAGRELWSTHGAHQLRFGVIWLIFAGSALFGPLLLMLANRWLTALGGVTWIFTTIAGVLAGSSKATGMRSDNKTAEFVARIAPYVFVLGILLALSYGVYWTMWQQWGKPDVSPREFMCEPAPQPVYQFNIRTESAGTSGSLYDSKSVPDNCLHNYVVESNKMVRPSEPAHEQAEAITGQWWQLLAVMSGLLITALALSWRVDINIFGLHMFYRNRIERCYMGASNIDRRQPHPLTGLDPTDSPALAGLNQRPFHIVNTALNITSGRNLAWQERKAASFTFTPLYCGYDIQEPDGLRDSCFQSTIRYLEGHGRQISLGLPITISGAAASPNSGYHTSTATAFLMTVFNVRLGWWLQNPRYSRQWTIPGPNLPLFLLLGELFGMSTDKSRYVYLSDGGHFENLGIYELVRRRCHYIIACDAGCDPEFGFEDLGNAIRKCQIDFGIPIDIDTRALRPDAHTGRSVYHCAVGLIHYEKVDQNAPVGFLLYLKSSLTGDEPADVMQYASASSRFPHESTADQCYSESQFESYRKLGFHAAYSMLAEAVEESARSVPADTETEQTPCRDEYQSDLEAVFTILRETWYPPSAQIQTSFAKYGESIKAIFDLVRLDENLSFLDQQIYPEWWYLTNEGRQGQSAPNPKMLPDKPEEVRAGFYLCNSLLQLMENVYVDLNLEEQYAHPDNRGWMNLFRHWSWSGMLRITWAISASTYGARFQRFCRRRLDLTVGQVIYRDLARQTYQKAIPGLNFLEMNHVDIIGKCFPNLKDALSVIQLVLQVTNPFEDNQSVFEYPFAFALVDTRLDNNVLIYYRVRDHLRDIGLGRKGLIVLLSDHKIKSFIGTHGAEPDRVSQRIPEANYRSLHRLWKSVQTAVQETEVLGRRAGDIDRTV